MGNTVAPALTEQQLALAIGRPSLNSTACAFVPGGVSFMPVQAYRCSSESASVLKVPLSKPQSWITCNSAGTLRQGQTFMAYKFGSWLCLSELSTRPNTAGWVQGK